MILKNKQIDDDKEVSHLGEVQIIYVDSVHSRKGDVNPYSFCVVYA